MIKSLGLENSSVRLQPGTGSLAVSQGHRLRCPGSEGRAQGHSGSPAHRQHPYLVDGLGEVDVLLQGSNNRVACADAGRLRSLRRKATVAGGFMKEAAWELDLERRVAFCKVRIWGAWDSVSDGSGRGAELCAGNGSERVAEERAASGEAVEHGAERKARPASEDQAFNMPAKGARGETRKL